jgi:hypothetical protein
MCAIDRFKFYEISVVDTRTFKAHLLKEPDKLQVVTYSLYRFLSHQEDDQVSTIFLVYFKTIKFLFHPLLMN